MSFKIISTDTFDEECDEAYEVAENEMMEYYSVSEINNLTQEQLDEIWIYSEDEDCEKWIGIALRSLIQEFMET
jgi:hypothetical protein